MVEIKGFNEAYKNCVTEQAMKNVRKEAEKRKVNELVAQGADKKVASAMVKALWDAGIEF